MEHTVTETLCGFSETDLEMSFAQYMPITEGL
jgi:hypothetical protein